MDRNRDVTRLIVASPKEYALPRFRVRVIEGRDRGAAVASGGAELSVGTDPANHLVLSDQTVSRHHCSITTGARGVLIRDLGSTNGTRVVDHRIEAAYLKPGSVIQVGETSLVYEQLDEVVCEPISTEEQWHNVLGRSSSMRRIFALVERIASHDTTVLLEGETGTGKGLLAEAIHSASARAKKPFVVVDCSAIAPSLIETELFGHERGSFTGAHAERPGAFELAQNGTVLLDEIGELPLEMQPKLLRALEERTIKRVGGSERIRLNLRVIAATNRDLRKEVNRGSFRADLFFRLNVVAVRIPPLRERREDIPVLVQHFYEQLTGGMVPPPEFIDALSRRDWPGNVRELRNVVESATVLGTEADRGATTGSPGLGVSGDDAEAGPSFDGSVSFRAAKEAAIARWEERYLRELLDRNGGNISRAARAAKTDRNYLRELIRRHGLETGDG